jgi:hypothetical protein
MTNDQPSHRAGMARTRLLSVTGLGGAGVVVGVVAGSHGGDLVGTAAEVLREGAGQGRGHRGPAAAMTWLNTNGRRYGVCRRYDNEPWHFEALTAPGTKCPPREPHAVAKAD